MNRMRTLQIALLTGWVLVAPALHRAEASQASEPAPAAEGTQNVQGPVDSALVIPKGPQFLGAPIMPGGTTLNEEPARLVTEYSLSSDQVVAWYKEGLSRYPDAKYRDWESEVYIEDQGGSKWHAIRIAKTGGAKTVVTIQQDNWTWILSTLLIRFVGVFVVLLVLWIALNAAALLVGQFIREAEGKRPRSPEGGAPLAAVTAGVPAGATQGQGEVDEVDSEMAAAICAALHCHLSAVRRMEPAGAASAAPGWQLAGRIGIMGERFRAFQRR